MRNIDKGTSYQEIIFDSFEEFYSYIQSFHKLGIYLKNYIFRGASKYEYTLLPRIIRENEFENHRILYPYNTFENDNKAKYSILCHLCIELYLLYKFYRIANREALLNFEVDDFKIRDKFKDIRQLVDDIKQDRILLWIPKKYYQIASLAQHYSIPTRLLDWTRDVNIAIYFALKHFINKTNSVTNDGYYVIWMLNTLFFQADYDHGLNIRIIDPSCLNNSNVRAQKGLFTLDEQVFSNNQLESKHESVSLEDKIMQIDIKQYKFDYKILYKLCIPYREIKKGLFFLYNNGYDNISIYPSLSEVANTIYEENMIINSMDNPEVLKSLFY